MRHWSEGSPRNALVKGEGVVCLCCPLSPMLYDYKSYKATHFCICLSLQVDAPFPFQEGIVPSCADLLAMAEDDQLAAVVSSVLRDVVHTCTLSVPTSSRDLLLHLISTKTSAGSISLRLTDLCRLDAVLENLANQWEHGTITIRRDGVLTIMDIQLGNSRTDASNPRKRKRPVDEEADSAAGDENDERSSRSISRSPPPSRTPLGSLSKELKEVYTLLQRSTAKGRLLAERVRLYCSSQRCGCDCTCCVVVSFVAPDFQPYLSLCHQGRVLESPSRNVGRQHVDTSYFPYLRSRAL